ncbi:ComEC/Rec2 family competence protein [Gordonia sp. HY442]|uniref:ComEC/Rec2 family competence protein n=1 Tax=Gordonia zhenghanii TaxID=2911516 RepID=UPI001F2B7364|nr:ComEC/Rec2 family competence protein [Gordonia zhenghanii]MCF8606478.1 ComEC/Rec2 family competence protein [Gordonia zhenghanii]
MVDLRLAAPAAACWSATIVGLVSPQQVSRVVVVVLVVTAAVAGWRSRDLRLRAHAMTVIGVCGIGAAGAVVVLLRVAAVDAAPIVDAVGKPVVEMTVAGDPMYWPGQQRFTVAVRVDDVSGRAQRPVAARLAASSDVGDLLPGERLSARVRVAAAGAPGRDRLIAADLTAVGDVSRIADAPWWQRAAGDVRQRLREIAANALGGRAGGLLPGLILGDTGGLDQATRDNFRSAGLSHLVAVSGANLVLVVGAVLLCVRAGGGRPRTVFVVGVVAVVGFVILVRPTDSVLRAAVMGGVGLAAGLSSRRSQALPALGAAVVVVLLWWPEMALAPGFALSVAATLGLVLWSVPIRFAMTNRGVPEWAAALLSMTVAAQILTTPLVIAVSGQVSVFAIPANLLAAPVVPLIGVAGTLAAAIGALGPRYGPQSAIAEILVRATGPGVRWLIAVADRLGGPGWVSPEVPGVLAAGVLVAVGCAVALILRSGGGRPFGSVGGERPGGLHRVGGWMGGWTGERSAVSSPRRRRLPDRSRDLAHQRGAVARGGRRRAGYPRAGRRGHGT